MQTNFEKSTTVKKKKTKKGANVTLGRRKDGRRLCSTRRRAVWSVDKGRHLETKKPHFSLLFSDHWHLLCVINFKNVLHFCLLIVYNFAMPKLSSCSLLREIK